MHPVAAAVKVLKTHRLKMAGLLASGFLLGGAIAVDDHGLFGQTSAAWVQAIGSIVAIIAAIEISREDQRVNRQEALKRESQAAKLILGDAYGAITATILAARSKLSKHPEIRKVAYEHCEYAIGNLRNYRFELLPAEIFLDSRQAGLGGLGSCLAWARSSQDFENLIGEAEKYAATLKIGLNKLHTFSKTIN